jgi:hypothetical protein
MAMRDIARYYGLDHIGKGILKLADYADSIWGAGKPIYMRPSFWTVVGVSGVLPIIANKMKWSWSSREIVYMLGGFVSTKVWDWIEEVAGGFFKTAAIKAAPTPTVYIPSKPVSAPSTGTTMLRK